MSATITPADAARQELPGFKGQLIGPGDHEYEQVRAVYNAMIDKRPGLIARCTDADDVAAVVGFARDHGLPLAVRGGGHNGGGLGAVDDGVVIDLSLLKDIEVDPRARTVRVGGGCTWGEVDAATGPHGLATPSGIISTTGVGRAHPRRRPRPPDPQVRADDRQPARRPSSCWRPGRRSGRAPTSIPTCTGRSGEAAATSAS